MVSLVEIIDYGLEWIWNITGDIMLRLSVTTDPVQLKILSAWLEVVIKGNRILVIMLRQGK